MTDFLKKKNGIEALKNTVSINNILNSAYAILGNPILMFDTSYNLLAYTNGITTDDFLWNELISLGTFSHETVDFFNSENFITAYAESETAALLKSSKLKYDRINGKLFDKDNVQIGNINITACCKPFEEGDLALVEFLCEILSAKLQSSDLYNKIDKVYQHTPFYELINGSLIDKNIIETVTAGFYENLKTNIYLAVADITQYEHTVTHLAYFRDLFKKIQSEYKYYVYINNIIIIISIDNAALNIKNDLKSLNEFFKQYKIYAGVSSKFQEPHNLKQHYREAVNALNYGLKNTRNQAFFCYDNYRAEHFINTSQGGGSLCELYSPVVFSIRDYDSENGTGYLNILRLYLLYGADIMSACRDAGIDPENFAGKLDWLEKRFGIDRTNGDMMFNLYITIKMLDSAED